MLLYFCSDVPMCQSALASAVLSSRYFSKYFCYLFEFSCRFCCCWRCIRNTIKNKNVSYNNSSSHELFTLFTWASIRLSVHMSINSSIYPFARFDCSFVLSLSVWRGMVHNGLISTKLYKSLLMKILKIINSTKSSKLRTFGCGTLWYKRPKYNTYVRQRDPP